MENTFWTALGASSLAALVTTIGIYVVRHFERWGRKNTVYFICFAAGVLISVSFLHIIPISTDRAEVPATTNMVKPTIPRKKPRAGTILFCLR